jgi:hypothetical protein
MDVEERGWEVVDWLKLNQDRYSWPAVVNAIMNTGFP